VARGFTLIEVLVALAVIAIGLLAVLAVAARGTHVSAELQQRNFAGWIAQNELARLRLNPKWPDLGKANDEVDFAHQKWRWDAEIKKTQAPNLRRVTITVALADQPDEAVTRVVGFIGKHPEKPVMAPIRGLGTGSEKGSGKQPPPGKKPAPGRGS
jgi:general secretion pathway protein I